MPRGRRRRRARRAARRSRATRRWWTRSCPAAEALRAALDGGRVLRPTRSRGRPTRPRRERRATIPLVARKGRASYLGERSAGHQDPGATSSALLVRCAARTWGDDSDRIGGETWPQYAGAIDQGTTSTRFMVFDHGGQVVCDRPEGARADLPQARLGRARPGRGLEPHRGGDRRGALSAPASPRTSSRPSASPTSARPRWSGTAPPARPVYNAIVWQDTRTDQICDKLMADGGQDRFRRQDRPAARHLLLRPQGALDPRQRRGRRGPGRGRASCCSATWTPGSSGTSPAAPTAACTSPTSPTPAARC